MLDEKTDEQLMIAYANNQIEAFQVLYSRYKTPLFRFILRQTNNQTLTEELFQDVWSKVIRAKDTYKHTATFRTYIYQITRNTVIDNYRRQSIRAVEINEDNREMSNYENGCKADEPSTQVEQQQSYKSIIAAINALSPEQRDAFLLKEEASLSIEEIAKVTQVKAETAKSRYRYAVKQLKILLGHNHDK